jgi:Cdc6-like AAA superfamily ATPase
MSDIRVLQECLSNNSTPPKELNNIYNLLKNEIKKANTQTVLTKGKFVCCPNLDFPIKKDFEKANHMYIAGATGSGKSYYIADYLRLINKYQPKREIFIFSDVEYDKAFENLSNVTRIAIDMTLVNEPITPAELQDSVCLFDDIDSIQNKTIKKAVYALMNSLYRRGRHENVTVISTTHNITEYHKSRTAINESSTIVLFLHSGSTHGQRYIMSKYIGLDTPTIKDIMRIKSRSVQIHKSFPMFVSFEGGCKLIHQ